MMYQLILIFAILFYSSFSAFSQKRSARSNPVYVDQKGIMRYSKGNGEVALFGVNYSLPFAYGYKSVQALGLDPKVEIYKDVYHMARLGVKAFRIHMFDTEISDSAGNLLKNIHLDLFDYLLAELKKRDIKIVITPIAYWGNGYPAPDDRTPGFSRKWGKRMANVNDSAVQAQKNFVKQLFSHVNPYTKTTFQSDPDIIAAEINNEPNHGPRAGILPYINGMVDAIRSTGFTKPLFYNISQNLSAATPIASSNVEGVTFQWYPTGLVANREIKGNFIPHVSRYTIPFDTIPEYRNKARLIYEFDPADVLQSNMLPAMARSFRSAGFQWATQFAWDPIATASNNTEYQTHYLSLAYYPGKAVSLLIASRVFQKTPRLYQSPGYPADSTFDVFRVSYRNNLSEMNSVDEFYYTNNTGTQPVSPSQLKHVAGVGSSPLVTYDGSGAYFLDKLEDGAWRLEVMPDAIHINDPYGRASPKREVTRIEWHARGMEIRLPNLGNEFSLQPLNKDNIVKPPVCGGRFTIEPGTYLLLRAGKKMSGIDGAARMGQLLLNEFVAPPKTESQPAIAFTPPANAVAGKPLRLSLRAAGLNADDMLSLQLQGVGRFGGAPLLFRRLAGNNYEVNIPAENMNPGILSYRIVLKKGEQYYTYPGAITGNPRAWDYVAGSSYELSIRSSDLPWELFNAATNRKVLTYNSSRVPMESKLIPAERPGSFAYRMAVPEMAPGQTIGFEAFAGNEIELLDAGAANKNTIVVRGRSGGMKPLAAKVLLITKDAIPFSATINFPLSAQDIEIPVSALQQDSMLLLPKSNPGILPLWFSPAGRHSFLMSDVERVQIIVGGRDQAADKTPLSLEIESIWIKQ
ncbi:cellulase family glycosylhydrolase [Niabella yanshanensis]|uniref:Cellulase family glycosylhydrolase n=1 Tax=Niabella yanshanensis TaxID=577386 RepID=A0ABZ0W436_9BACT|nr:cellulase family glycosylhydrolase [Niabella yanshanensis]WQD38002.1 cellulase family glycosylhydrolase [Niabella yanshanensis]